MFLESSWFDIRPFQIEVAREAQRGELRCELADPLFGKTPSFELPRLGDLRLQNFLLNERPEYIPEVGVVGRTSRKLSFYLFAQRLRDGCDARFW